MSTKPNCTACGHVHIERVWCITMTEPGVYCKCRKAVYAETGDDN